MASDVHTSLEFKPRSVCLHYQRSIITRLRRGVLRTLVSPYAVNHNVLHASFVLRHHLASLAARPDLAGLSQPHRPANHHLSLDLKGPSPSRPANIQATVTDPNPGLRPFGN